MQSLPEHYKALIVGASGAIGSAMVTELQNDPRCGTVIALGRETKPHIDYRDESSIAAAASELAHQGPFHLIVITTGMLHHGQHLPEKRLAQLNAEQMMENFRINTMGPALVIAKFVPLLVRNDRAIIAALSAKVGSIGDNRLGGWYSYRATKAALNMMIKTASIELARTHPKAVIAALHPGTVNSRLSAPFKGEQIGRPPADAAYELLQVLDGLQPDVSGSFWAYNGQELPW